MAPYNTEWYSLKKLFSIYFSPCMNFTKIICEQILEVHTPLALLFIKLLFYIDFIYLTIWWYNTNVTTFHYRSLFKEIILQRQKALFGELATWVANWIMLVPVLWKHQKVLERRKEVMFFWGFGVCFFFNYLGSGNYAINKKKHQENCKQFSQRITHSENN